MRITAVSHLGHWSARFADGPVGVGTFGGPDVDLAIRRLLANSPARHLTLDDFEPDAAAYRSDHMELVLVDRWDEPCLECSGSGKYVGLNLVETCRLCG